MKPIFTQGPLLSFRFLILLLLALGLIILDGRGSRLNPFRAIVQDALLPIEYALSFPADLWHYSTQTLATNQSLETDNNRLHTQQLLLLARVQQLLTLRVENNQLRALLRSAPVHVDKILAAQLVAVNNGEYTKQFLIDRGQRSGIYLGQPVLDAYGVIGQVTKVAHYTSRVMLLTDKRSAIPVEDLRNNIRAIAVGNGRDYQLSLINVPKTTEMQVGDKLVTSGLGQVFPSGYPVGEIIKIEKPADTLFAKITVMPFAHLQQSRLFLLVKPTKQQDDDIKRLFENSDNQ